MSAAAVGRVNNTSPTKPREICGAPVIDIGSEQLFIKTWRLVETIMITLDGKMTQLNLWEEHHEH